MAQALEVLRDMEDAGEQPSGAALLDSKDARGFRGLCRAPFGWPSELIRLVFAACFRSGAIYLERQSGSGPAPLYDYNGSDDYFAKISNFRKVFLRVAETSLSVDQLKQASKALIGLGVNGVPESGNAIAEAIRELGAVLSARLGEAKLRSQQGLPIPHSVTGAETSLQEPTTLSDPTECVTSFLEVADQWQALSDGLKILRIFVDADRHREFEQSCKLEELASNHPLAEADPQAIALEDARRDMAAIVATKEVIGRWPDFRSAFETAFESYRDAYTAAYEEVRMEVETTVSSIRGGSAYANAPADQRDAVVDRVFGPGKVCDHPPLSISSVKGLLDAASYRSLTSVAQTLVALPGYRAQVEAGLRALVVTPFTGKHIYEWRSSELMGRRMETEGEVDEVLGEIGDELKARIREGFTIVVK